ncbi:hypothetical protein BCR43DRAFT_499345 [Syncephalastrum racemosum]|uniref:F-box domain-containing protein n=1 Tax=Syncephalastrum racemosum TaxID=13706 RepID=A0A1X2H061_SYNRA|nr:hypothetical protein BCR43DRAFT_499345 [Syncephalastrum racemosum]
MIPETRFTCIHISTVWRQILLSLPQLWKQLNVAFKKEFIMANGHLRRDIEKRFRTFLMPSLESFQMTTDVDFSIPLSWVTRSECKGIKKIVVFDYNDYELMPQISMQKTLPYFATSLAHLAITSASSPRGSYMRFLLSVLPKLQSLQYRVRRLLFGDPSPAMQNHFSGRIVPQGSDLRLLAWPVVSDSSGQRIAEYLAAYCPKLRDIAIADFDEDELDSNTFVDTVLRDCHELRCFSTGPYRLVRNSDMEEQNGGGLKFILFHHKIPFPQKTIASIFEEQQQNLEEFYYAAGSIVAFPLRMVESSICLQRLHTLCIDSYGQLKYQPSAPLTYILRGCPVLQNICFSHVKVGRDISSAIVAVPQLTMLTLYECKFKSCDALCHLVGMLASKNTLKGLTLAPDPLRSGSHLYLLIPLLFSVGSLRYLRLVGFNSMIRDGSIEYVEDSRRCQRLWPRPKPGGVTFHAVIIRCSG